MKGRRKIINGRQRLLLGGINDGGRRRVWIGVRVLALRLALWDFGNALGLGYLG